MGDSSATEQRIAAHRAGLSTFPVGSNKRPLVSEWRSFMEDLPETVDVLTTQVGGYAIVCGRVSDNLVVFDFEGGFGRERWARLIEGDSVFESWARGYAVSTPHQGIHVAVHVSGECPHNTKLAFADGHVIAEIRGEGGYVVGPGSNGDGAGWSWLSGSHAEIVWTSSDEVAAFIAKVAAFDESPAPAPLELPPAPSFFDIGDSWIARVDAPPMSEVLGHYGWQLGRAEAEGILVTRPGKDPRLGHSGRINLSDRLLVWSTNAEPVPASRDGRQTFDWVDVVGCYQLGRLPLLVERTEILRGRRPAHPGGEVSGRAREAVATASDSLFLPASFWQERPWLSAIFDAGMARMVSPDAILAAFISAYATTIPVGISLPAVNTAISPLNIYVALAANSGGGKTGAMSIANELLGWNAGDNPDIKLGCGLRSGEGLITLVLKPKPKSKDPLDLGEPSYNTGVQVHFDEGGTLGKQTERIGSTTIPYLNTAWSGSGIVGGAKAGEHGSFPADKVRICAVMGVQYGAVANLFTGESARLGFPQRIIYAGLDNPILSSIDLRAMNDQPLVPIEMPRYMAGDFTQHPQLIGVPDDIKHEVREWSLAKILNGHADPLDGHRMLVRLRMASIFALTDGRFGVSEADWELARQVETSSRSTRSKLVASLGDVSAESARAQGRMDVIRQDAAAREWLETRASRLYSHIAASDGGLTRKQCRMVLRGDERKQVDAVLAHAVMRRWVAEDGLKWIPGKSRPA